MSPQGRGDEGLCRRSAAMAGAFLTGPLWWELIPTQLKSELPSFPARSSAGGSTKKEEQSHVLHK